MHYRLLALIALSLAISLAARAQDVRSISSHIDELRVNESVDDETRSAAIALLTEAKQTLVRADDRSVTIRGFIATAADAEQTLQKIRLDLDGVRQESAEDLSVAASVGDLNARLAQLSAESADIEATIRLLGEREAALGARSDEIVKEIAAARLDVDTLLNNLPAESAVTEPVADANKILHSARSAERRAAIDDLVKERATLPARQQIVAAQLNLAAARSAKLAASISRTQEQLGTYRSANATARLENVERQLLELSGGDPALRAYGQENVNLARANLQMVNNYASLTADASRLQQDLVRLTASAQTVDQVLATGQLNDDTAELLRNVLRRLPNKDQLADTIVRADRALVNLRLNQVLWQDRLRDIAGNAELEAAANRLLTGAAEEDTSAAQQGAVRLVELRRELLQELNESALKNSLQLGSQQTLRQNILRRTTDLAGLLDRHLLWLPTNSGFGEAFVANLISNIAWITSPAGWRDTAKAIVSGFGIATVGPMALGLLALALGFLKKVFRRRLEVLAARVGRVDVDTYMTTPEALGITLLLTLPWSLGPAAVGLAAMQAGNDAFSNAIGQGVLATAAVVFILVFLRMLGRNDGVFHRHYGWSESALRMLRFNINWFITVEAIVAFVFTAALASGDLVIKYGIGRLAFMASAVAIALFAFNFLKPRGGIVMSIDAGRQYSTKMKLLFVLLVAAPLIIGILPAIGYFEAAIELQSRIFRSGVVVLLAAIIYRLFMRVFMVGHRRLIAKQAQENEEREQTRLNATLVVDRSGDATPMDVNEERADLDVVANQTRRAIFVMSVIVLMFGLWGIWGALLPALGIVNEIILWDGIRDINGVATSTGISLWDFSVALLLIVGGFVIARNIAGLLELVVFDRVTLVSGTRYAVTSIAKYILVSVGIVAGLSRLGLDWSSMQWVVAALGVGLGFGLQEIVANFVSGLIILFERPIRVGDIVTIGELDGTVTSIQIRATRITDFDNREVLLPNKSIITENVTNWTLNDQVTRIILRVGVAYGSDIDFVRDLILDAVSSHPDTLPTPAPAVFFMAHGDSSLEFEARVFVATPNMRLPTTHDLNRSINLTLAKHGVEIPFPQRDVHVRTAPQPA